MKSLQQVRQAYDENYQKIIDTIHQMGGDDSIKSHRQEKSKLYRMLKELQHQEHYLDELENRLINHQNFIH